MCPGGASGGMPVAVIAVGSLATLLLVGSLLYVANTMSHPERCFTMSEPERCFQCKEGVGGEEVQGEKDESGNDASDQVQK